MSGAGQSVVAAVIPHWNRADLLPALFENLAKQARPFDRVILVDNGSVDGSAELAEHGGLEVVRLAENQGFAAAVNQGIKTASGGANPAEWIAILNNDVTLDPGWLRQVLLVAELGNASFATGKILSARDPSILDGAWDEISRGACAVRCGAGHPTAGRWNHPRIIRFAPMTAALFRRELFEEVGKLDELFVSYLEDVDFGLRCAKAGRSGLYEPSAIAYHQGSATWGRWHPDTVRYIARNQLLLTFKHFQSQPVWPLVAGQLLWGLIALRHGCGIAWFRGKLAGWRLRSEVANDTHNTAAFRKILEVSEAAIFEAQSDMQGEAGRRRAPDLYWRMYAWLTRPRSL